jgi:hypothetical protein
MQEARALWRQRTALARVYGEQPPLSSRLYEECVYGAASWAQPWRVIVQAEVMTAGDNPRFGVTSLAWIIHEGETRSWGSLHNVL